MNKKFYYPIIHKHEHGCKHDQGHEYNEIPHFMSFSHARFLHFHTECDIHIQILHCDDRR